MKTTIKYLLFLALAGFVFTGCATHRCCKSQQWEYKTVGFAPNSSATFDEQKQVNLAANGGWKLVSVTPEPDGYMHYIFERPKQ
jgi:hypothetical protein